MFPRTKTRANGAAAVAVATDKMPPVPTLEEAHPELGKAQTALGLATERVGQLEAELNATRRAYDNLGPIPPTYNPDGSGQVLDSPSASVAAAWRAKVDMLRAKIEQLRAKIAEAKLEWRSCKEAADHHHDEAREAVAAQLRPYWAAVTRDFAIARLFKPSCRAGRDRKGPGRSP
jgi:hypothetical protein